MDNKTFFTEENRPNFEGFTFMNVAVEILRPLIIKYTVLGYKPQEIEVLLHRTIDTVIIKELLGLS